MAIRLEATDKATVPTGIDYTVSGSPGAWSIFGTPADRPWPGDPWIPLESSTGNATGTIAVEKKHWFFIATGGAECTLPERVAVTDGLDPVATRCRSGIIAVIKSLNLEQIGDRVLGQIFPDDTEFKYPCVSVHVAGLSETEGPGLNMLDDITYPARIMFYDVHAKTDHRPLPKYERWRQAVARSFRNQHVPGVTPSIQIKVEPLLIADLELPQYQHYAGGLLLRCSVREPRGIGA